MNKRLQSGTRRPSLGQGLEGVLSVMGRIDSVSWAVVQRKRHLHGLVQRLEGGVEVGAQQVLVALLLSIARTACSTCEEIGVFNDRAYGGAASHRVAADVDLVSRCGGVVRQGVLNERRDHAWVDNVCVLWRDNEEGDKGVSDEFACRGGIPAQFIGQDGPCPTNQ